MCGIIGYTGTENSVPYLIEGLRALEYRGYDSSGIALCEAEGIRIIKTRGRIEDLEKKIDSSSVKTEGNCGIGHTRWATHGAPSDVNSHPHGTENLAVVHNGTIENYAEIAEMLASHGYSFLSETDTEVAAKLIDFYYERLGDPVKAIFEACDFIRGSYAFGVVFKAYPNIIYSVRRDSPLIVASTDGGGFIASDIPAILKNTSSYYQLEEGVIAVVGKDFVKFLDRKGKEKPQKLHNIDWDVEKAQKGGFAHFMIKEIYEEPHAVEKTVKMMLSKETLPDFGINELEKERLSKFKNIHIVACGTAMHAGLIGKNIIEKLSRIPVNVDVSSEFRYRDPILHSDDLVILLSQSGETADTLAALRHAKRRGVFTLSIVNVVGSSIAREADAVIYTSAGPEISVASTKAYSVQCALLYLLGIQLARAVGRLSDEEAKELCRELCYGVPKYIDKTLSLNREIEELARDYLLSRDFFFIGRGIDSSLCAEASLKLKEISYIHSEAYAAGELKHGTISLITEGTPIMALLTVEALAEKMILGIKEVKSRGAKVLAVTTKAIAEKYAIPADKIITVAETEELFAPFAVATVVQLFAYHVASQRGCDVDKPRNLAKSVTVE